MINHTTEKRLDILYRMAADTGSIKLSDNDNFKDVYVDVLNENHISVAQYNEHNEELIPCPEMEFYRLDSGWIPVHYQDSYYYQPCLNLISGSVLSTQALRNLSVFSDRWIDNIFKRLDIKEE